MDIKNLCTEYCIGCGLCKSEYGVEFSEDNKGFLKPNFDDSMGTAFLDKVCPVTDKHKSSDNSSIWGSSLKIVSAYATDHNIRNTASSGGVLTALAIYLLESGKVDAIIQVKENDNSPMKTVSVVSQTREGIIQCCGSRYAISSPWLNLSKQIEEDKVYAAIAKPCDITALRNLQDSYNRYTNIKYLFSFFCAGLPSKIANKTLLSKLGCSSEDCRKLVYRGNGWPGYATATDKNGKVYRMQYSKAWGEILGRDVNAFCRLCMDGIGEKADISCGDGWYINDGEPDFSERDGRNVVFVRNSKGMEVLDEAISAGYIEAQEWEDIRQLEIIQKYQFSRRATMQAKLKAYKLCGRRTPSYDKMTLAKYAKDATGKQKIKIFLGTVKRILQKKI